MFSSLCLSDVNDSGMIAPNQLSSDTDISGIIIPNQLSSDTDISGIITPNHYSDCVAENSLKFSEVLNTMPLKCDNSTADDTSHDVATSNTDVEQTC